MVHVGVVGFGFMGRTHFQCYQALEQAQVVAVCDTDAHKFQSSEDIAGNIAGADAVDLSGIQPFTDFAQMLAEADLDAISITLPTHMHAAFTVQALDAGFHVLCEKPMATDLEQCNQMIAAAERSGRRLQIGHCIRFWPEYAVAKRIVDSGKYGKVIAASFRRLSAVPLWSWNSWLMGGSQSGGALLDLHIHDADFVQYLFGMPETVYTQGVRGPSGDFDHVTTQYGFADEMAITAEGTWFMASSFGFEMSFNILLEKATLVFDTTRDPTFRVYPQGAEDALVPEVAPGDGYTQEIEHFVRRVAGEDLPDVITPEQSCDSVRLALAEKRSAETRAVVSLS